ncbi:hydrogenase maturation protease [Candidatus Latescibacterota bacterium]
MTTFDSHGILVIGFGNPAREDDGIGPAVAEEIEKLAIDGIEVDADYQLTVEDAAAVAEHDAVVFVDASIEGDEPYTFTPLAPKREETFSSHSVSPEGVMGLARDLFDSDANGYMLGIRGYSFEMFTEKMTGQAHENMIKAIDFLVPMLRAGSLEKVCQ